MLKTGHTLTVEIAFNVTLYFVNQPVSYSSPVVVLRHRSVLHPFLEYYTYSVLHCSGWRMLLTRQVTSSLGLSSFFSS